jgi:hypothetical protein
MSLTLENVQVLRPASLETEGRPYRVKPLEVIDYETDLYAEGTLLVRSGSIGLFAAPKGSALLDEVRRAATAGDGSDREVAQRIREQFIDRKMLPIDEAVRLLIDQPVFASMRYGGRTLATSIFTPPGADIAAVAMPYNGGRLASDGFSLVEHYREDSGAELDAFVLRHAPALTRAESAALDKLPAEMLEMNVGNAALCYALSLVGIAVVVSLATGICCPHWVVRANDPGAASTPMPDLHIGDAQVERMSAATTARHLLRIRREMLEHRL